MKKIYNAKKLLKEEKKLRRVLSLKNPQAGQLDRINLKAGAQAWRPVLSRGQHSHRLFDLSESAQPEGGALPTHLPSVTNQIFLDRGERRRSAPSIGCLFYFMKKYK